MHTTTTAANNINALRRVSTHASTTTTSSRITPSIHTRRSTDSRILEEVLHDGDQIGPGLSILDQPISIVHARSPDVLNFRVIRKLAAGSYAVVYLVQEIVPLASTNFLHLSEDEDSPPLTPAAAAAPAQGRFFALKCLEKHAQDQEAQLLEATIHHSLPVHKNIVTLWTTLETDSYLLLVLDYVPGEDLFYFLEQFRDYEEPHHGTEGSSSGNPPINAASLAYLEPSQLLSYHRLRLVASMFSQMCEAVAHCHRNGVFHRDIKPENFMVTESREVDPYTGESKRIVIVKLTDFGLATCDTESGDMDCGSAPYMSFECRNFITPMYATAPADVWSLGVVLLNMLYHANPWMSSAYGACQSFDCFLREPMRFFMERFPGMTPAVADFFAKRVFCLLETPASSSDDATTSPLSLHYANNVGRRITAEEFGLWARDLQLHLGPSARRTPALAFQQTPSSLPATSSPRPRSPVDTATTTTTTPRLMAPSVSQPGTRTPSPTFHARPRVPVHPAAVNPAGAAATNGNFDVTPYQSDSDEDEVSRSRTTSSKRRKRAPRGNKSQTTPTAATTVIPSQPMSSAAAYAASVIAASGNEDRLRDLAAKSQIVAREASKLTKTPPSTTTPLHTTTTAATTTTSVSTARSTPELRPKRSTKWNDIFRRDSGSDQEVPTVDQVAKMDDEREETASLPSPTQQLPSVILPTSASVGNLATKQTPTARHVSNLIMGLNSTVAPSNPVAASVRSGDILDDGMSWTGNSNGRSSSLSARGRRKDRRGGTDRESQRAPSPGSLMSVSTTSTSKSWSRGHSAPSNDRRARSKSPVQAAIEHFNVLIPTSGDSAPPAVSANGHPQRLVYVPDTPPPPVPAVPEEHRGSVPIPSQVSMAHHQADSVSVAGQSRRSYAPSIASVSTTTTASSAFTAFSGKNKWARYSNSNASVRSVSTAATSVSSSSSNWRNGASPPLPANIKPMKGIPKELGGLPQLPRHMQRPKDSSKSRNHRGSPSAPTSPTPGSSFGLDTISEKPKKSAMKQSNKNPVPPLPSHDNSSQFDPRTNDNLQRLNDAIRGSDMDRFDQDPAATKSFGAGRGLPSGLQIDTEIANAISGHSVATVPVQNAENVPPVAPGRPAKPSRSRLWSWKR